MSKIYNTIVITTAVLVITGLSIAGWMVFLASPGTGYSKYVYPLWSVPVEGSPIYDQLRVSDLNGDGLDDVVVAGDRSLEAIFQNSRGEFENRTQLLRSDSLYGLVLEDLDGDSAPDICCRNSTSLIVLFNNGSGGFDQSTQYTFPETDSIRQVFAFRP